MHLFCQNILWKNSDMDYLILRCNEQWGISVNNENYKTDIFKNVQHFRENILFSMLKSLFKKIRSTNYIMFVLEYKFCQCSKYRWPSLKPRDTSMINNHFHVYYKHPVAFRFVCWSKLSNITTMFKNRFYIFPISW